MDAKEIYRLYGAGDGKTLHLIEETYFIEIKRFPGDLSKNIEKIKSKGLEQVYFVYKYLRERGYISKPIDDFLLVFQRGFRPGENKSKYLLVVNPDFSKLKEHLKTASKLRKTLVYAFVNHNKVNFLKISKTNFE